MFGKWINRGLVGFLGAAAIVAIGSGNARANTVPLLDNTCVWNVDSTKYTYGRRLQDAPIGRELKVSYLYAIVTSIEEPITVTCRISTRGNTQLELAFSFDDRNMDTVPRYVSIYVDGTEKKKAAVQARRITTMIVDVTGGVSVAVEITCPRAICSSSEVEFTRIHLVGGIVAPGRR